VTSRNFNTGEAEDTAGFTALAELYHRYLTGLILALIVERGAPKAAEVLRGLFRRQHLERFLPGLRKLGLEDEPHAVACAKYHYLSNHLGGVRVVYIPESERKAWVRYLPPRWIFDGTALAAIPTEVSRAMLHGWHGHNGVSLGNPRLGFVCTGQTMVGAPGLEGYYIEEERELAPEERVRFRFGEVCPPIDPERLPRLREEDWPESRRAKVGRNYAMDYVRNLVAVLAESLGPLEAGGLLYRTGRRIGMQFSEAVTTGLGEARPAPVLARLLAAHGDTVRTTTSGGVERVEQQSWRLFRGLEAECCPEWFDGWRGLFEGVLAVADRRIRLEVGERLDVGGSCFAWELRARGEPRGF
jgi:hypothetical protein